MKPNAFATIEFLLGVSIVGILTIGIWLGQKRFLTLPLLKTLPTPTISSDKTTQRESSEVENQTANWKTFINENYHYSIKYPPNFVYGTGKNTAQIIFDLSREAVERPASLENKILVITVIEGMPNPLIERTYLGSPATIVEEKSVEIGGRTGQQVVFDKPVQWIETAVVNNQKTYYFNLHKTEFRREYQAMLSTFRFLEPSQVLSPSPTLPVEDKTKTWKVYTNTEYGYQLKYPPDYRPGMCNNCSDFYTTPLWTLDPPEAAKNGRLVIQALRELKPGEIPQDYLNEMVKAINLNPWVPGSKRYFKLREKQAIAVTTTNFGYETEEIVVLNDRVGLEISFTTSHSVENKGLSIRDLKNYEVFELILASLTFSK